MFAAAGLLFWLSVILLPVYSNLESHIYTCSFEPKGGDSRMRGGKPTAAASCRCFCCCCCCLIAQTAAACIVGRAPTEIIRSISSPPLLQQLSLHLPLAGRPASLLQLLPGCVVLNTSCCLEVPLLLPLVVTNWHTLLRRWRKLLEQQGISQEGLWYAAKGYK